MTEPTFDKDGYPTDETLWAIQRWPATDVAGCLDFCRAAWHWPEYAHAELTAHEAGVLHATASDRFARFATGGWSGNETIIRALRLNEAVHARTWRLSTCGGLHIYEYPQL